MQRKLTITVVLVLTTVFIGGCSPTATEGSSDTDTARPPNILLIISDDFGMDVTSNMYPGLIDDLVEDPLEEYPLAKPGSCSDYSNGAWVPAEPQWHYCRLTEVVDKHSVL